METVEMRPSHVLQTNKTDKSSFIGISSGADSSQKKPTLTRGDQAARLNKGKNRFY
jgi:hypothetical protein